MPGTSAKTVHDPNYDETSLGVNISSDKSLFCNDTLTPLNDAVQNYYNFYDSIS